MVDWPSFENELQMVLGVFKDRGLRPGEGLSVSSLATSQGGTKASFVVNGLRAGIDQKFLKNGPNGFVLLTEAGFVELSKNDDALGSAVSQPDSEKR